MPAAFYLMDLARGAETLANFGTLTILATNANTGDPLRAEVVIDQISRPLLEPRLTSRQGRFDWVLPSAPYTGSVSCEGYESLVLDSLEIISRENLVIEVALTPLERVQIVFRARDLESGEPVLAKLNLNPDNGQLVEIMLPEMGDHLSIPVGRYQIEILAEDYLPLVTEIDIRESRNWDFDLVESEISYEKDFSMLEEWQRGGAGQNWSIVERDGRLALTESPDGEYSSGATAWILLEPEVYHNPLSGTVIQLIHQPYFEPGVDEGLLRVWDSIERDWVTVASFSQFPQGWDTTYVSLDNIVPGALLIRLEVHSDNAVEEDGWLIDQLTVISGNKIYAVGEETSQPFLFNLSSYPNPTNSATIVKVSLDQSQRGQLSLYNIAGQRLGVVINSQFSAGENNIPVSFQTYPSGLYFLQFQSEAHNAVIPVNLLK